MLRIAGKEFNSRLFLGSGKYASSDEMYHSIIASGAEMVTVALKRVDAAGGDDQMLLTLRKAGVILWPNTSGARTAKEAVFAAQLAREALQTNWLKLEIHPDPRYLMPDAIETLKAAEELVKDGFIVLPYIHADPVLCKKLEDAGVAAVMPLGSPIGSNKGLSTRDFLEIIIAQSNVPVIVDAGIGAPSHASEALEMGADAVLVNTAIATAADTVKMAEAFKFSVMAGRIAYESGLRHAVSTAQATSPMDEFLLMESMRTFTTEHAE
jgi:thiazole synthase